MVLNVLDVRQIPHMTPKCTGIQLVYDDPYRGDELRGGWAFRVGTWNVDSLTGRLQERVTDSRCFISDVETVE